MDETTELEGALFTAKGDPDAVIESGYKHDPEVGIDPEDDDEELGGEG